jgi:hypothetical protein
MAIYSDVRQAVRNIAISTLTDYFPTVPLQDTQVIFSHGKAEPIGNYVVVNILNITQQGRGSVGTLLNAEATKKISVNVAFEVQVQYSFVGKDSGDISHTFNQRLNAPMTLEAASKNKLGIMRKTSVRRAPQKRDTLWVDYHNMDVTFSYIANTQQALDWVEAVVIEDGIQDVIFTVPEGVVLP